MKETLKTVLNCLEEAKAEDTISIDISGKSSIGDYMIVTSGRSNRIEGQNAGDWVLMDCGDIIIHVFRPEIRDFYNIEKMWMAPETDEKVVH